MLCVEYGFVIFTSMSFFCIMLMINLKKKREDNPFDYFYSSCDPAMEKHLTGNKMFFMLCTNQPAEVPVPC